MFANTLGMRQMKPADTIQKDAKLTVYANKFVKTQMPSNVAGRHGSKVDRMSVAEVLDRIFIALPSTFSQECRYWIRTSSGQVSKPTVLSKKVGDSGQQALHAALAYERLVLNVVNDPDTGKLEYNDDKSFASAMKKVYPKLKTGHEFNVSLVPVRASCPSWLSCLSPFF